ncbi:MAG: cadherin-like beta sandwich domain-containing protein [Clostridiales bacterium]|nr:cadherin-like beta sandwich domain-containing protein [Clostridiales bacterium]
MKKINKILITIFLAAIFTVCLNLKSVYARVVSTDRSNVEPGSTVTIDVSSTTNVTSLKINNVSYPDLTKVSVVNLKGGDVSGDKVIQTTAQEFSGAVGRYSFKVPNGYSKTYTVTFSGRTVNKDLVPENFTSVATIKTKAEPKKEEPKKEEPKKSSEEVSKKEADKSNKIAVEKAVDTTKSNKSSNNYLKNISTSLGTLSPAFNRSQTSYILSFPYDFDYKTLEKISINAVKEDTKEKIEGTGVKAVKVGTNVYNLVVTAENGETRTYAIKLIKPEISEDKNMRLATLKLTYIDESGKSVELPLDKTFNAETFEYSLNVESIVKSIKIDTTLPEGSEGIKVSVSGNEDLQDGENVITITLFNEHDDTENPKKTIYTIKVNKAAAVTAETAIMQPAEKTPEKKVNFKLIIGIILGIILLLIMILIILLIVSKKQSKDNEPDDYGFISEDDENDENNEYYEDDNEDDYDMNYTENPNQESFNTGYIPDEGFVKNEDIEKAKILGGYESKILNSDFDETPEFDEEITSSFNDEKKNNRHQKGKRFL